MKHPWMVYVIVVLLAICAGVAIAGLPDNTPSAATIVAPGTTEASAPRTETPETTEVPDTTDVPATTEPETTEPETTEPETTEPETTEPEPSGSVAPEIPERSELIVVVANGAGVAGAAARNVVRLTELGYVDPSPRNGTETVQLTTVYYAVGFEAAAARLASDLELLPEFVAPLTDAPQVQALPADVQVLAYIGADRA
jgi:hypothetical protein